MHSELGYFARSLISGFNDDEQHIPMEIIGLNDNQMLHFW